jgi:hypothetical protein
MTGSPEQTYATLFAGFCAKFRGSCESFEGGTIFWRGWRGWGEQSESTDISLTESKV